jgi:hypothetical protein
LTVKVKEFVPHQPRERSERKKIRLCVLSKGSVELLLISTDQMHTCNTRTSRVSKALKEAKNKRNKAKTSKKQANKHQKNKIKKRNIGMGGGGGEKQGSCSAQHIVRALQGHTPFSCLSSFEKRQNASKAGMRANNTHIAMIVHFPDKDPFSCFSFSRPCK